MALQMLYQSDLGETRPAAVFLHFDPGEYLPYGGNGEGVPRMLNPDQATDAFEYAKRVVDGVIEHLDEIDELIRKQAENWRLERMSAVDRNVLRLAVYEFQHEADVPQLVVVDEAIELAKKFGSEQSGRFVNGLLDGLLRTQEFPGSLK